jgi:hypothetical protein
MRLLIARWYQQGKWSQAKVEAAVVKGWITQAEADAILNAETPETD